MIFYYVDHATQWFLLLHFCVWVCCNIFFIRSMRYLYCILAKCVIMMNVIQIMNLLKIIWLINLNFKHNKITNSSPLSLKCARIRLYDNTSKWSWSCLRRWLKWRIRIKGWRFRLKSLWKNKTKGLDWGRFSRISNRDYWREISIWK